MITIEKCAATYYYELPEMVRQFLDSMLWPAETAGSDIVVYKIKDIMEEYKNLKRAASDETCLDEFREMNSSKDLKEFIKKLKELDCDLLLVRL